MPLLQAIINDPLMLNSVILVFANKQDMVSQQHLAPPWLPLTQTFLKIISIGVQWTCFPLSKLQCCFVIMYLTVCKSIVLIKSFLCPLI